MKLDKLISDIDKVGRLTTHPKQIYVDPIQTANALKLFGVYQNCII